MTMQLLERRLTEAYQQLLASWVDPSEVWQDDGQLWSPLGGESRLGGGVASLQHETVLRQIREQCRHLATSNEFAINGHENRVSYLVGSGHTYRATMRKGEEDDEHLTHAVQRVIDQFLELNEWQRRQQEIVRRFDRDGEVFLRQFVDSQGVTRIRFIEPDQVTTPAEQRSLPAASLGILTANDDVEEVLAYFVDGEQVPPSEVQHRKANVDANVKRGLPLFYPVRKNLRRAEKLLRNMSVVAEIQSAIALIRKHQHASKSGVQQFVAATSQGELAGQTTNSIGVRAFGPGTILDAPGGVEYDFPAAAIDAGNFVTVLQAELRAIASRLVMPEFMLSSDASNANYASTMVAEGPAVRMFSRLQAELIADDRKLLWQVIQNAARHGRVPLDVSQRIELQITAPSLSVRDQLQEVRAAEIEFASGILSPQTWSQRRGLDYDQEQANLRAHESRHGAALQGTAAVQA